MSGLAKLEARIDALAWLAETVTRGGQDAVSVGTLNALRSVLVEARDLVAPDYGQAEDAAEAEEHSIIIERAAEVRGGDVVLNDVMLGDDDAEPEAAAASPLPLAGEGQGEGEDSAPIDAPLVPNPTMRRIEREVEAEMAADGERWDKPLPAPAGVIRQWAHKHGITCPAVGLLSAHLLNVINDRRRMMRLRPFVQSATAAGGEA